MHDHCKVRVRTNVDGDTYMIPSGFTMAGELRELGAHLLNGMLMNRKRSLQDMMNFCFSKITGKNGIMRKMCNGSRTYQQG